MFGAVLGRLELLRRTIKGVHEGVAGDGGGGTAGGCGISILAGCNWGRLNWKRRLTSSKRVVNTSLVSSHGVLNSLICRKVDGMRGT